MAVEKKANGDKVYGPYEKQAKDGKRKIYVTRKASGAVTSTTKSRKEYEDRNGKVPKGQEVDHKDSNKNNDSPKNLRVISKSANVAKENKRRAKK